jgi:hypothetical protein
VDNYESMRHAAAAAAAAVAALGASNHLPCEHFAERAPPRVVVHTTVRAPVGFRRFSFFPKLNFHNGHNVGFEEEQSNPRPLRRINPYSAHAPSEKAMFGSKAKTAKDSSSVLMRACVYRSR